jgi:hypothetical protein
VKIDSLTMSAPTPELKLVVLNPTNRLGRMEPNNDHDGSRFPPRVSANCFGRYRHRRVRRSSSFKMARQVLNHLIQIHALPKKFGLSSRTSLTESRSFMIVRCEGGERAGLRRERHAQSH